MRVRVRLTDATGCTNFTDSTTFAMQNAIRMPDLL